MRNLANAQEALQDARDEGLISQEILSLPVLPEDSFITRFKSPKDSKPYLWAKYNRGFIFNHADGKFEQVYNTRARPTTVDFDKDD